MLQYLIELNAVLWSLYLTSVSGIRLLFSLLLLFYWFCTNERFFIQSLFCSIYSWCSSVKRETLKLVKTFLDEADDKPQIGKQFVSLMMDPVLGDYARNVPDARESEVLSLFATIVNKYASFSFTLFPFLINRVWRFDIQLVHLMLSTEYRVLSFTI